MTKHPLRPHHRTHRLRPLRAALATLALTLLSGCASVYLVDNQVQSFARWSDTTAPAAVPQAPQTYRFERLPSQATGQGTARQDALENLARVALAKVGWSVHDAPTAALWTVQVGAGTLRLPRAPWEDPWEGYWGGFGFPGRDYAASASGQIIWSPVFMRMDMPYYKREVSLVVRHAASARVVYESRAAHEGRWNGTPDLWSAMLDAALRDFPAAPDGVRQVNIEVPR
ncbi:MAG: DUF4136 domain-containing protein [Hydrogenophaga sp.]|uniref:DUF4136 domain-containing protein n=1 Tax=Hydrogenophaga sp. TaxID=1904254 RepID=UPI002755248C|nr:DUF4136 domain-containing protein [Hydrogenophaga sp.]MDP2416215.1 DUF4136 domain-containing protein [Hydrogenophaga sp.]MDZ4190099.1 DUF4136 domain-containing protein [Hydrogenophaga sp.]